MEREQQLMINRVKVGVILKKIRSEQKESQIDTAIKVGYSNATFVCMVEKGGTSIPIEKVVDFAKAYAPGDAVMLSAAIMKLLHPTALETGFFIINGLAGNGIDSKSMEKKINAWIKKQTQGVEF